MKKTRGRSVRRSGPARRIGGESFGSLYAAGIRLIESGRFEGALGRFRRAARRGRSDDPRLLFNIGFALARLGRSFSDARAARSPDWLKLLQSLAPCRPRKEIG